MINTYLCTFLSLTFLYVTIPPYTFLLLILALFFTFNMSPYISKEERSDILKHAIFDDDLTTLQNMTFHALQLLSLAAGKKRANSFSTLRK